MKSFLTQTLAQISLYSVIKSRGVCKKPNAPADDKIQAFTYTARNKTMLN